MCLGSTVTPCKGSRHASWNGRWHKSCVMTWLVERACGTCHGMGSGTHHLSWLDLWHHAMAYGTCHGTGGDMRHMSSLSPWAPCKGLWHASWHERWHASRVLAWPMGTMQGVVACVRAQAVALVTFLSSARGHHTRACGTRYGTGSGKRHVSWLGSWAP